jgi:hypothetical protein
MKIPLIALSAMFVLGCVRAADLPSAPLAVYYSFDSPPSAVLFAEMQAELDRILAGAELRATWRPVDSPRDGVEHFPGVAVFRFRGACWFQPVASAARPSLDSGGNPLADTARVDGHVLPFAEVDCDRLRRFMAPALRFMAAGDQNRAVGRAAARVSAHELYHILTGSGAHANQGIASASHSVSDLAAPNFDFAIKETNWLRDWAEQHADKPTLAAQESGESEAETGIAGR